MGRRKETTDYLKECIADSMIRLMEHKPLEKINVEAITTLAGVGRATYFRNFTSKADVLEFKLMSLWRAYMQQVAFPVAGSDYDKALWFFTFCQSIQPILKLIYKNDQRTVLLDAYFRFTENMEETADGKNVRFLRMFMSYGSIGIVTEWARGGFRETPEELVSYCLFE